MKKSKIENHCSFILGLTQSLLLAKILVNASLSKSIL